MWHGSLSQSDSGLYGACQEAVALQRIQCPVSTYPRFFDLPAQALDDTTMIRHPARSLQPFGIAAFYTILQAIN
jgi:hypothetical protein